MRCLVPILLFAASPALAQHDPHAGHTMPEPEEGGEIVIPDRPSSALRWSSGTSWQPGATSHGGVHLVAGDWMIMGHAALNAVYDWQQGPRGGEEGFVSGMVMASASRDSGPTRIEFRAMLSPDPLMGASGYPLHLAAGESADGVDPLIDRQHPHDFFMELSAGVRFRFGRGGEAFLYAGLPGEPAFGPPAFMHRLSIMDSPEAPVSHHWLDSTHISFGVITAGLVLGDFKIEGSRFNGREPDQNRWDIETGPLDSTAVRLSWNPTHNLSLQLSWAHLVSPEQLEPAENSRRWSASAIYTSMLGDGRWFSATLAWGNRDGAEALVAEAALGLDSWTIFGRAEYAQNNELTFVGGHHGPLYDVGKVSLGVIRDFRIADHVRFGIGGLYAMNFVPGPLEAHYAGDPDGAMLFIRLRVD